MRASDSKKLPDELTSYDLLKSFALVTMIIDHVGFYLFPDEIGWRIVGRMSLPVWMFLVGYAKSREIGPSLLLGAVVILLSNLVFGEYLLPLNILFTIMLARLLIDRIMQVALEDHRSMWLEVFLLAVVTAPLLVLFDYGTHALLFAMSGYLVRHREHIAYSTGQVRLFMLAVCLIHSLTQAYLLETTPFQSFLIICGVVGVGLLLSRFGADRYPLLTDRLPSPLVFMLQTMGRHTLALYVAHLLLLKSLAAWLVWDRLDYFGWRWFL